MPEFLIKDIQSKTLKDQKFFVDTNVWIFNFLYSKKSFDLEFENKQKMEGYSQFIEDVLENGGQLYTSPLCLTELAYRLENFEYSSDKNLTLKEFRSIKEKRDKVINEIELTWKEIESLVSGVLDLCIDHRTPANMLNEMKSYPLDSYDAMLFMTMKKHKITNLVSDDKDFRQKSDIDVYHI